MLTRGLRLLAVAGDIVAVNAAMIVAYWVRFRSGWLAVPKGEPLTQEAYLGAMVAVTVVQLIVFQLFDLYRVERWTSALDESYRVLIAGAAVFIGAVALSFFYREFEYSRLTVALAFALAVPAVSGVRAGGILLARRLRRRPAFRRRVALLGADDLAGELIGDDCDLVMQQSDPAAALPALREQVASGAVDHVLLQRNGLAAEALLELLSCCEQHGAELVLVPDRIDLILARGAREEVAGIALLHIRETPLDSLQRAAKRLIDAVVAGLVLLLLSPLLLLIGLLVRLTSPGPALYRQTRVTEAGRRFEILKFRTMRCDAEHGSGAVWATAGDPRRTRLGAFLRRTSLDELPQLWNVLRGDMSLIGPRPERPEFVAQFAAELPRYGDRHRMKAGISGWAQVNGERGGGSDISRRTRYDLYYIDHWSLMLDLQIAVKTVFEVLFHRGAG